MTLTLEYVRNSGIRIKGEGSPAITVEMEYLPECSKNSYKLRNGVIKKQVRDWMEQLAWMVKVLMNSARLTFKLPVKIMLAGEFKDNRSCPDLHNMILVICDAVANGLGMDDRYFEVEVGVSKVVKGCEPKLIITISGGA